MSIELSNGVILPDIPSDILTQYPYAVIAETLTQGEYWLYVADAPMYFSPRDVASSFDVVVSPSFNTKTFVYKTTGDTTAWDDIGFNPVGITNPAGMAWSNHDIYEMTSFTDTENFTTGDVYFKANLEGSTMEGKKYLGVAGVERLIDNICSLIDAVLPSDGTTGQILMIGADGNPVWADAPSGGETLSAAEEVMFG